jgi:hypothetical protein
VRYGAISQANANRKHPYPPGIVKIPWGITYKEFTPDFPATEELMFRRLNLIRISMDVDSIPVKLVRVKGGHYWEASCFGETT